MLKPSQSAFFGTPLELLLQQLKLHRRRDGHSDHEATARACASATRRCRARLLEVPVWAWSWAQPGDPRLPWRNACRVPLDSDAKRRKCFAIQAYESQLLPDESTGAQPVLDAVMLQRAARPFEVLFEEHTP